MNTLSPPAPPTAPAAGAAGRRARYALQSAALLLAATTCCVLAALLASRFPARFDATATREHRLSARTMEVIGALRQPYEVIVAANFGVLDPGAAARTRGVLENFGRASANVRTNVIDVASAGGAAELDRVLGRVGERFAGETTRQRAGLTAASTSIAEIRAGLGGLSEGLVAAQKGVVDGEPNAVVLRSWLGDAAAQCRLSAEELSKAAELLRGGLQAPADGGRAPGMDELVLGVRKPLGEALSKIGAINDGLDQLSRGTEDKVSAAARSATAGLAATAAKVRGEIGAAVARLDELPKTPVGAVTRLLQRSSAAVIVGPPGAARGGVTSIDLASIFPARGPEGAGGVPVDLRARTEELLSGALASLSRADAPVVVFVHGRGVRISPSFVPVAPIVDRLGLRGVDFAEWAVALDNDPPSLAALDPKGERPVVWVVISMAPATAEDGARLGRLAQAAADLVKDGRSVLLNAVPSSVAALGQKDAMTECLAPLGVEIDTARPLLRQTTSPRGRVVTASLVITDPGSDQAISRAVRGQAMVMPWAVPVRVKDAKLAAVTPVVSVGSEGGAVWAESEWLSFLQTPQEQQPLLLNPPAPDTARDDAQGPWVVAAAVERTLNGKPQRVLVVGNNRWMDAGVMSESVDAGGGRTAPAWPGNLELFDAGVSWLAGQDALIAESPAARAVPVIPPLSAGVMSGLRWGLIGGLPVVILLIGAGWRLWRG